MPFGHKRARAGSITTNGSRPRKNATGFPARAGSPSANQHCFQDGDRQDDAEYFIQPAATPITDTPSALLPDGTAYHPGRNNCPRPH